MLFGSAVIAVVPAYEEAPRIARVVRGMPPFVDRVVVVDDASTDGTAAAARATHDPRLEVVVHRTNSGVGAAIVTGYRAALTVPGAPNDALVVMAGDGQMDPHDLPKVVAPIACGAAGYVKGDRFRDPDVARVMPPHRLVGNLVFSWLTSLAIAQPVRDSQCGYTALSRRACEALDLDDLWTGYGYPNDLLGMLAALRIPIAEVGVRAVYADEVSRLRPRHAFTIARMVARAWTRRAAGTTLF